MTKKYTEGIMGDGATILADGVPLPVEDIVKILNSQNFQIKGMQKMLLFLREALSELPQDIFGYGGGIGVVGGEVLDCTYPIRDDIIQKIDMFGKDWNA